MSRNFIGAIIAALLVVPMGAAQAQLGGPGFPPPGEVDFGTAGTEAGDPGGLDFIFSNFDPSAFTLLYWGPQDANAVLAGLNGPPGTVLTLESIIGQTASWSGSTWYVVPPEVDPTAEAVMVPVFLDITVSGLGANPWVLASTVPGLDPGVGAVVDNSSGADFTAKLEFKADLTVLTWGVVPLNTVPQLPGLGEPTQSSFSGGFFWNTAPVVSCTESVNPAGKTIPPDGKTTLPEPKGGQNEDGFYVLRAIDDEDGTLDVWVTNASGLALFGPVFGPFASETTVKITEAPGATPNAKPMGGPSSAVAAHIKLDTDAVVFAIDSAGALSSVNCLVPPPPK